MNFNTIFYIKILFGGSYGKVSAYNVGDLGSIPGLERSPGEGNGNPLQYSCLENPMDGGAWWATVHGVAKSRTRLSNFTHSLSFRIVLNLQKNYNHSTEFAYNPHPVFPSVNILY